MSEKASSLKAPDLSGQKLRNRYIILVAALIITVVISITLGRYAISFEDMMKLIFGWINGSINDVSSKTYTVFYSFRLPRIIAAFLVGAGLSVAGASYQAVFRNPVVSPDILGASSGSGFGAAIAILLSFNFFFTEVSSFVMGIIAVALTYIIASRIGHGDNGTVTLVLTGMVISSVFSAFISLCKYVADPYSKLPAITFWLMGSLAAIVPKKVYFLIIPMLLGMVPLFLIRWRLNVLSFGDEEAKTLGVNTKQLRFIIIVCSTIITAASVTVSGLVGWVGLIVPHLARMIVGHNYKQVIPASILLGGTYLLLVDDVARNVTSSEIPLGILTAIMGGPFFIYLLLRENKGNEQ
jgi:iron complex transport system permease protein